MARYDRAPSDSDDAQQRSSHDQEHPSSAAPPSSFFHQPTLHLPDLTNAIRARASSIVSALASSSTHYGDRRGSLSPLLSVRTGSISSGSSSAPTSPNYSDKSVLARIKRLGNTSSSGSTGSSRSQRSLSHHATHVRILRIAWCLALLMGEVGSYWVLIHRCSWPENDSWDASEDSRKERYRIAIIADPQLTDWFSYKQTGLLLKLVETYTDLYMKRSFRRSHSALQPDAVLFLGDLNDGGRDSSDDVFVRNSNRFLEHVFQTKSTAWNQQPVVMDAIAEGDVDLHESNDRTSPHYRQQVSLPQDAAEREAIRQSGRSLRLYVAGNHDIGFGDNIIRPSVKRFKDTFGSLNYEVKVGNHSLVILDTLSLSAEVQDIREESQQFLTQLQQDSQILPRILFTHVPLFRLDTTPCGKARESKKLIINRGGYQYWNMVNASLSRDILRGIRPDMVFSGDDHDWCEIAHSLDGGLIPEVTLRAFSFAQGIQQPGFVMLSLYNPDLKPKNEMPMMPMAPSDAGMADAAGGGFNSLAHSSANTTFAYNECMLPNQLLIYLCYGIFLAFTSVVILLQRYRWMATWGRRHLVDQRSVLVQWRDTDSHASTTATSLHTTAKSQEQQNQPQMEEGRYSDSIEPLMEAPSLSQQEPDIFENIMSKRQQKRWFWAVRSGLFWRMAGWDLWNISRYAIPLYVVLFVVSTI
ncbi:hypothetical protein BGZ70_007144 [Mortierella alpina]|uniref:Calcineurin-like phosphoesterase domain-containing protein n=1 Tax=Mortierella alpina TaxID=64518 RepID=A0A9P6M2I1_MORAP|nr:hypothetical protein BGZ70_007144 [Mortierella alpina]